MTHSYFAPLLSCLLLASAPAFASELSQDPIGDARSAIQNDADFDAARVLLEAFESHALESSPPVSPDSIADMNFLMGVMEYYLNQDEEAAKSRWAWSIQIKPSYAWDEELVGGAGQDLFEEVRQSVTATASFAIVDENETLARPVFIDGSKIRPGWKVQAGQHLVQAKCSDGIVRGVYAFVVEDSGLVCPCPLDSCTGEGAAEKPRKERSAGTPGKLGITGVGGGWYSSDEGFSPMAGLGLSYRPLEVLQLDLEGGAYLPSPLKTQTDGGFGRVAVSYLHGLGGVEVSGGIQANLLLAEALHTMPNGDQVWAFYSGLVTGLHGGAALTLGSGHQVGARIGYLPFLIEFPDVIPYHHTMTDLYFRYSF